MGITMTHRLLSTLLLFLCVYALYWGNAGAQGGGLLFVAADQGASSREFTDTQGLCTIYIVHDDLAGGSQYSAVRFKIDNNDFTGTWVGDNTSFQTVGNSQSGISVVYSGCLQPPVLALAVTYACEGTSGCTTVSLVPDPGSLQGQIEAYDCDDQLVSPPVVAELCVNGSLVEDDFIGFCSCQVPVEPSTWGAIKAVYE